MKPIIKFVLTIVAINLLFSANFIDSKLRNKKKNLKFKKQVHVVYDQNGFHSEINQVIRRNPTLTVETRLGAERLAPPEQTIQMSNSNTSNGYNLGSFGKTAELVGNLSFILINKIYI
jgi:hypothetical protein